MELEVGSIVFIDSGQVFIVMKEGKGYTIAEVEEKTVARKDVWFRTLLGLQDWLNECESKISKVLSFKEYLLPLHDMAMETLQEPTDKYDLFIKNKVNDEIVWKFNLYPINREVAEETVYRENKRLREGFYIAMEAVKSEEITK